MLRVEELSYRHAHCPDRALSGLNFELPAGQALLLGGRSGSGKSTLLSVLSGLVPHYFKGELSGRVELKGESPGRMSLSEWGFRVGLMMQNPEAQFLAATVEEELLLSLRCREVEKTEAARLTAAQLERFGLEGVKRQSVFQLSEGQKQKVVLAALTALKPKLLLLDEPSANLDPASTAELGAVLASLKKDGLSLVIADHRLSWLNGLCDQVLMLDRGRAVCQGSWDLLKDEERRKALNLRSIVHPEHFSRSPAAQDSPGVAVEDLTFAYRQDACIFSDFNSRFNYGRVCVITGRSGRGKTTLARVLCGLSRPARGRIIFDGETHQAVRPGQVVLQNADHQLYMPTVLAEIDLARWVHGLAKSKPGAEGILADFGLEALADRHPQSLSGGEKQRLVVAAGLAASSRLLVLDEPTSGLDGLNLQLMAAQIKKAAERGLAVLVITHDLELAHLCGDDHLPLD